MQRFSVNDWMPTWRYHLRAPDALPEQMDAALFRRAPLADFVLPSGVADELDAVFGTLNRVDYYGVFGVSRQAHSDDIKERFHALAQLAHPTGIGASSRTGSLSMIASVRFINAFRSLSRFEKSSPRAV